MDLTAVPFDFVDKAIKTMQDTPRHTYLVLTKRPKRMLTYFTEHLPQKTDLRWPLENVWLGTSCENQEQADKRIPLLLQTPAAKRFISIEPCLEYVDLTKYLHCGVSWCIIGAESGSRKRYFNPDWARRLIKQCQKAQIPVFYKQNMTEKAPRIDGKQWLETPNV